jgi:TonB-dependent receptor
LAARGRPERSRTSISGLGGVALALLAVAVGLGGGAGAARAQVSPGTGVLVGQVYDSSRTALSGAIVAVLGSSISAATRTDGSFRLVNIPAGGHRFVAHRIGFAPDSFNVTIVPGGAVVHNIMLTPAAVELSAIVVQESPRLAETKASALALQLNADNIVAALSGDEIRSLPNFNAAEAAGRTPGVSLERDEGEGKFVQVRGTEPRLSGVTINGAHVPGTEGNRIAKLDDVPSDLLAAIVVSKTLSADMDADAIGGSINLRTKTPEGAPRGYIAAQYGQINLAGRNTFQGGFTYGGRVGQDQKLGFLIGGSADRNNRAINDVEPVWGSYGGVSAPNEWALRDYRYGRERFGVGGDLDYRPDANSQLYVKGLWSDFRNYGDLYIYDVAGTPSPAGPGSGTIPGASLTRTVNTRTPHDQMWALTAGGSHGLGNWTLDFALDVAGTNQHGGFRFSGYGYNGPALTLGYSAPSGTVYPKYQYQSAADSQAAADPANYTLGNYYNGIHTTSGRNIGGAVNAIVHFALGGYAGQLQVGARYRDEHKDYTSQVGFYVDTAAQPSLTQLRGSFSDPGFYTAFASGYAIGPMPDPAATLAWESSHATDFQNLTDPSSDSLGSFSGSERVTAGYLMSNTDVGPLHVNIGLRVEATHSSYRGHALTADSAGNPTGLQAITGTKDYTDFFPSVQLRYALDPETDVRLAVTRGIARPNYPDLAPNQSGSICATCANQPALSGFTTGNPNLKPQYAWNYDVLFSHYLTTVGVLSGGVFYKDMRDVILTRRITYTGPGPFNGYQGYAPDNGGTGWLYGVEAVWTQRFVFLPGFLAGLGIDANYTHTSSKVLVSPQSGRHAALLRQSPDIANVYVTYDKGPFSARVGWTFNGAMISSYGDGTPTPTGDTYFAAHGQVDGSIIYNATSNIQIQAQVLNINNAPFGFFIGTPGQQFNIQREYYKQTFFLGTKIGF